MQTIDFFKIKQLRSEIRKLLKERPSLQKLQDEIDTRLSKAGNTRNRLATIQAMLFEKVGELSTVGRELSEESKKLQNLIDKSRKEKSCE